MYNRAQKTGNLHPFTCIITHVFSLVKTFQAFFSGILCFFIKNPPDNTLRGIFHYSILNYFDTPQASPAWNFSFHKYYKYRHHCEQGYLRSKRIHYLKRMPRQSHVCRDAYTCLSIHSSWKVRDVPPHPHKYYKPTQILILKIKARVSDPSFILYKVNQRYKIIDLVCKIMVYSVKNDNI